ncbi:UNVERIFIED_CONTAM: hypothetical protein ABIE34_001701 [Jeotgalibacillus campisalis]
METRWHAMFSSNGRMACEDVQVTSIDTKRVPQHLDGPSLVAAASALMLLPKNASRLIRLHRLAALGMALTDNETRPASPSAVRNILKRDDIGGHGVLMHEDPYSEVLVQSVRFAGGPYLVSSGSGEHAVADLEQLVEAAFRDDWMPGDLRLSARRLIQGLLTVSDIVLTRAGLHRGTAPEGTPRTPIDVPGATRLAALTAATYISNDELDVRGDWLRTVVDTFALDPGELRDPCFDDITDDRLYENPFLRLAHGYRVVLPLDLAITIRFHLLRFTKQAGLLEQLGRQWREAALRRFMRSQPGDSMPAPLEESATMSRYLLKIDSRRDLHVVVATDPLLDWELEVWGSYDTHAALKQLTGLVIPKARRDYSKADELVHLVITDSPGRGAFWGVPNVDDADPVIIARTDDLEVMLHHEPDGLVGLFLFANAIEKRPGRSMSTGILDEFCTYIEHDKSFYLSDDAPAAFTVFQTADGLHPRLAHNDETDRHGVVPPIPNPFIVEARRRYAKDAPEVFIIEPNSSYAGYVVEFEDHNVFVTASFTDPEATAVELGLLECVAYWIREITNQTGSRPRVQTSEVIVELSDLKSWQVAGDHPRASKVVYTATNEGRHSLLFAETFPALLQSSTNAAEREIVRTLLKCLFCIGDDTELSMLDAVAPIGDKRMLTTFNQEHSPDMKADRLPRPLRGHGQVSAQLLDELGEWLISPAGGGFTFGNLSGKDRNRALNIAVKFLFDRLEAEIRLFDQQKLLDFLIAQNESLLHDSTFNELMLRSRLACFGEQSDTVAELVRHRKDSAKAQRANRFLIEYVAAQPPTGRLPVEVLDYYRILEIAQEIIERATVSDFLAYELADFQVSILESGRLGVSREEPVAAAMERYASSSGMRSIRAAMTSDTRVDQEPFDVGTFIVTSEPAMRAEFGFTLNELRAVCGGLLDVATADELTRIGRREVIAEIAVSRDVRAELVATVLDGITISERSSFLEIGADAWPWRFNRDMSFVRRPIVQQGDELVYGFRSIQRLGPYWVDNMLSGRLQGRAKTLIMQQCISDARGRINDAFARSVAARLEHLGMKTRIGVKKFGKLRIAEANGNELGDIDVLAVHTPSRSVIAIEAKDFEVARIPAEISRELEKLFKGALGKKSTAELHTRRVDWLKLHLAEVVQHLGEDGTEAKPWRVVGAVVTSEPLITPLVSSTPLPVIPVDDLSLAALNLTPSVSGRSSAGKTRKRR